jgi:hypothetical protein
MTAAAFNRKSPTTQTNEATPDTKKPRKFAVERLADWIIEHCTDAAEIEEVKQLAKEFSFGLASAIAGAVDRNERANDRRAARID